MDRHMERPFPLAFSGGELPQEVFVNFAEHIFSAALLTIKANL